MDPLTHGLIGASAVLSVADREKFRPAAVCGMTAAMLADVDIFIHNPEDPLLNVELHRQFTHSLVFIPVGALIAAALLYWFMKKRLTLGELYGYCLAGYATAGITDTFTSYGTVLLWPFVDERYSWNIISVFDPLFTIGILVPAATAVYLRKRPGVWIAWGWILFYLTLGLGQRERGEEIALVLAQQRNHQVEQLVVKPTIGNQLLWNIRYKTGDSVYTDGILLNPVGDTTFYKGASAPLIDWQQEYAKYQGTVLYDDIRRFSELSDGFLVRHPDHPGVIGDARYAMLPTSVSPLWGIKTDTTQPGSHVPFLNFRRAGPEVRSLFLKMITGEKLTKP